MKKWIPSIVIMVVAVSIFIWCKCTDSDKLWIVPLSEADKTHLKNEIASQNDALVYWDSPLEWADPYYGTINNCVIVKTEQISVSGVDWGHINVADYVFCWTDPIKLHVYRDGEVCLLEEAYEKGWLTEEHIEKLYQRHREYIELLPVNLRRAVRDYAQMIEKGIQSN